MAASIRTLCSTAVFQHSIRHLSTTCCVQGGLKWRLEHGLARSGSEYGPMTDLPDWSFADGRPAPPMKGQLRRKDEREALTRRIVALETEIDKGMDQWEQKQELAKEMEVQKNSLLLKRKGNSLLKKKK